MTITTLNNLHTPVHYYIRVRQGTNNANYRFVEYNYRNDVVNLNDGEIMGATAFYTLKDAKLIKDKTEVCIDIPNIYIDIIKHTVKVSVVTDEVVED